MSADYGQYATKAPKGYSRGRQKNYTPQQFGLSNQAYGAVDPNSMTSRLARGDQSMFEEMEAPSQQQFSEEMGGLASRFSQLGGAGSLGSRKSSGFQNEATGAASDFAMKLRSQRLGLRQQAVKDLHGMSMDLLNQRPYENYMVKKGEKQKSGWGGVIGAGLGAAGGFFAGGPPGAMTGANLGYQVGNQF